MTFMKTKLKATLVATAIATLPLGSFAAGLGGLNVMSGLGQPLRAEIEVQATPEELRTLTARVAPPEAFIRANMSYAPVMSALNVSIETRGSRSVVRVSSDRPIDEPFLEMLVELNWAEGRLLREYTFLLDPIDLARPPIAAAAVDRPAVASPPARPLPAPAPRPAVSSAGAQYQVARGDTLHRIATRNRPADTTVEQMMIALLRQNPEAFVDGNINRLRAGAILTIPDSGLVQGISVAEARREVVAQTSDFEAYRRGLATSVSARPAEPARADTREQVGQIVPRVVEPDSRDQARDRVEVSGAGRAAEDDGRLARLQSLEEELVARERSLDEAYQRLSDLEQSIRDLQALIELRNTALAQMQQQLTAAGLMELQVPEVSSVPEAPGLDAVPDIAEADLSDAADVPAEMAEESAAVSPPEVQELAVSQPAPQQPAVDVAEPPPRPVPPPAVPAPDPFAPQPTLLQTILKDPMLLAAGGGILILLLAYAAYRIRQKRKSEEALEDSTLDEVQSSTQSNFGEKGGQSIDTEGSSILHTDFSQSGLSAIDADEGVDPVAEADVYMAYGRDAQAEEILLDALKADPTRNAVYLKLLEIYAQREDGRQFESVATDLYSRTGGRGADWEKAAQWGRKLDPTNPLYKPGHAGGTPDERSAQAASQSSSSGVAAAAVGVAAAAGVASGVADEAGAQAGEEALDFDIQLQADEANVLSDLDFTTSMSDQDDATPPEELEMSAEDGLPELDAAMESSESEAQSDELVFESAEAEPISGEAEESAEDADFSVLDFDLGSEPFAPMEPAETPQSQDDLLVETSSDGDTPPVSDNDTESSLDFDFDLNVEELEEVDASNLDKTVLDVRLDADSVDGTELDADEAPSLDDTSDPVMSADASMLGDDFDLELTDLDAEASSTEQTIDTEQGVTGDEAGLEATVLADEFLRDALEPSTGAEGDSVSEPVVDLEKTGFDNDLLDFDFDLEPTAGASSRETSAMDDDLSSIDLDLDLDMDEKLPEGLLETELESSLQDDLPEAEMPSPDVIEEVDTKLDLARAYEEMGDNDGARELIEEVLKEGSPSQREAAQRLLDRLG